MTTDLSAAGRTTPLRSVHVSAFPAQDLRAGLVADVALQLALCGRSVLVVDWSVDGTSVEGHLRRVPGRRLDSVQLAPVVREALQRTFGAGPEPTVTDPRTWPVGLWWRHTMRTVPGSVTVAELGGRGGEAPSLSGRGMEEDVQGFCAALKFTAPTYDHVLLYGAGPRSPGWVAMVVGVADVAVLGLPSTGGVPSVVRNVVHDLRARRPDNLDLLATVPGNGRSGVDDVQVAADLFAAPSSVRLVAERPGTAGRLELGVLLPGTPPDDGAARQISRVVTGLGDLPVPPVYLRAAYARAIGLTPAEEAPVYRIAYTSVDRPRADRLAGWLRAAGVVVRRFDPSAPRDPADRVLAVLSRAFVVDRALWESLPADVDAVRLDVAKEGVSPAAGDFPATWRHVDLREMEPEDQRSALMGELDLFVDGAIGALDERRSVPAVVGPVPDRGARFTGREDLLETIRDAFAPWDSLEPRRTIVVLTGEPGVGKSRLAAEYVHRFADTYTGVVWTPGRGVESGDWSSTGSARMPRQVHDESGRWLVVLDNVEGDATAVVDQFRETADVLVTTTSGYRPVDDVVVVAELDEAAGGAMLRDERIGLRGLTDGQVRDVMDLVGGAPIPLTLAAAGLRYAVRRLQDAQVSSEVARQDAVANLVEAGAAVGPNISVTERVVRLLVDELRHDPIGRLAVRLAELCASLSPDGVGLPLIRSAAMVGRLADFPDPAGTLLLADELELDRVLALGARFGLFDVSWGESATLRMHRVLQRAVRALLPPEERIARQADTLRVLGELTPFDHRAPGADVMHAELRRHFAAAGAAEATYDKRMERYLASPTEPGSPAWAVRRWVVEQVAFMFRTGDRAAQEAALRFVGELEPRWSEAFGPGDPLRCRLASLRGGLLYDLGRVEQARIADERALSDFRRSLGIRHPRAVLSADGLAGDLRSLGRFDEALPEAETVWAELRATLGEDHPRTLAVAYNLAQARFLAGQHYEALAAHRRSHQHRERVLGREHLWFRQSVRSLGFLLRETGGYRDARLQLDYAMRLQRHAGKSVRTDAEFLRAKHAFEVTLRRGRMRRPAPGDEQERLIGDLGKCLGEDHPDTLAAVLNWSAELIATGRGDEARRIADGCVRRMAAAVHADDHPFVGAAMVDTALARSAAGDLPGAVTLGFEAVALLGEAVEDHHPWLLTAQVDLAGTLLAAGRTAEAAALVHSADALCSEYFEHTHPVAVAITANLAVVDGSPGAGPWATLDIDIPPA